MGLHAPELIILYALDMFLVLSIVTVLFDSNFPIAVPYFFQIISMAGTGHMYVGRFFNEMFTQDSRFWYSFFYLDTMLLSAFALTAYLVFYKKSLSKGLMFLGGFSLPSTCFGLYILTFFKDYSSVPKIFSYLNGSWLGVMMLGSFVILILGSKLFIESNPKLNAIKQNIFEIPILNQTSDNLVITRFRENSSDPHFHRVGHIQDMESNLLDPDETDF